MIHEPVSRRGLIKGIGLLIAAPAIVQATSLMPVKELDEIIWLSFNFGSPMQIGQITVDGLRIGRLEGSNDLKKWTNIPFADNNIQAGNLVVGRYYRFYPPLSRR